MQHMDILTVAAIVLAIVTVLLVVLAIDRIPPSVSINCTYSPNASINNGGALMIFNCAVHNGSAIEVESGNSFVVYVKR